MYLISYLRNLLVKQIEADQHNSRLSSAMQQAVNSRFEENKESFTLNVGSNDKYLISKLRSYNISLEKID